MSFINTTALPADRYTITIDAANVGLLDDDFEGFEVIITIGSTVITKKLLANAFGYNPSGQDIFEFEIADAISEDWLLTIEWINHLSIPDQGRARNLKISGLKIERLLTELWKVDIGSGALNISEMDISAPYDGTVAGGWLTTVNSYGSVVQWRHEGVVYPSNDTYESRTSLGNILTASTNDRLSDIVFDGSFTLPNSGTLGFPAYTGISVS